MSADKRLAVRGSIAAVACAVPKRTVRNADFHMPELESVCAVTGVMERRWADIGQTTSTFCKAAVSALREEKLFKASELAAVIVVTQTPDTKMPGVAHHIHRHIGAPNSCIAFDVNMACSGYIYGLYLAMQQADISGGPVLLITGDTTSKLLNPNDRSTVALFGDGASATLIEPSGTAVNFVLGSDGAGVDSLCTGPVHRDGYLPMEAIKMIGPSVMNFALRVVPETVEALLTESPWCARQQYYFHQANKFILDHLVRKCGIRPQDAPSNIERYGNTSSTSIPLLLCSTNAGTPKTARMDAHLIGFGAGYSWGGCALSFNNTDFLPIVEVRR